MKERRVYSVDMSFLVAVDPDVSREELEEGIEAAITTAVPGVGAYSCPHLLIQSAGALAFCCPTCGGAIRQETQVTGSFVGEVNMASGMVEDSQFEGEQRAHYTCSVDPGHEIPSEFEALLRNAIEISADADL